MMANLPLINFAASLFKDEDLKSYYIIGVQHILPTTHRMFEALFKKGLKPENLSLIGKCYSTDHGVYRDMIQNGIDVCPSSVEFDSHQPFDILFKKSICTFLKDRKDKLNSSKFKKVIILDDGGDFLMVIDNYLEKFENVVGIEQTSSGFNRLLHKDHQIPIINLARAKAKLTLETPHIINKSIENIKEHINNFDLSPKKILVIGSGIIGHEMHLNLKRHYTEVVKYDICQERSNVNTSNIDRFLKEFDMIIGCTGNTSVNMDKHPFLKKESVLISMSSSDREFDAVHFRKKVNKTTNCYDHIYVNDILLLNCGFPIVFNGKDADDPSLFQFTRALIMACIAQAHYKNLMNGLVDLDECLQGELANRFRKILA